MKVLLFTNFLKAYVNKRSKNKSTDKKTKNITFYDRSKIRNPKGVNQRYLAVNNFHKKAPS